MTTETLLATTATTLATRNRRLRGQYPREAETRIGT